MNGTWCKEITIYSPLHCAGCDPEFGGEPLIREESLEVDTSGDGRPDVAGNQGQTDQKAKSPSTDQQTQESEVCFIRQLLLTRWPSNAAQHVGQLFNLHLICLHINAQIRPTCHCGIFASFYLVLLSWLAYHNLEYRGSVLYSWTIWLVVTLRVEPTII